MLHRREHNDIFHVKADRQGSIVSECSHIWGKANTMCSTSKIHFQYFEVVAEFLITVSRNMEI